MSNITMLFAVEFPKYFEMLFENNTWIFIVSKTKAFQVILI